MRLNAYVYKAGGQRELVIYLISGAIGLRLCGSPLVGTQSMRLIGEEEIPLDEVDHFHRLWEQFTGDKWGDWTFAEDGR